MVARDSARGRYPTPFFCPGKYFLKQLLSYSNTFPFGHRVLAIANYLSDRVAAGSKRALCINPGRMSVRGQSR